ncbi:Iron-sulfur cluster assembly scaffold protein IscU/NifU-like [hydrothermal vent metagenome]|uniref:Nitrogen fixation protein NifU n=1 Tax=hydrothermal vent metagenome TaxID=652676 RepID=A0A3B1E6L1_9ZZZZ
MARSDMISGNVWEQYSKKVQDRMNSPVAMGELNQEDAKRLGGKLIVADFGAESCGDAVRLFWVVDEKTDTILESKFKSFGCGTAIASSDAMAELCIGKKVDEAIHITNTEVEQFLRDDDGTPAVPPQKMHCSVMAYDVILEAVAQYKGVDRETLENQDIVCECARKTKQDIVTAIKDNDLKTIEEVVATTKAGSFCKSCVRPGGHEPKDIYLVDILADVRAEMDQAKLEEAANTIQSGVNSFDKMTIVQRIKAVDAVIDEYIRPMLVMDGGDMEIIDIKENLPYYDIYIRYLGACGSCASGSTGTLYAIESTLKAKVDENIRVLPV